MSVMPFICIGLGIAAGALVKKQTLLTALDTASQLALAVLMFTIGLGAGMDPVIIINLPLIGLRCAVISLMAIMGSVSVMYLVEKTVLSGSAEDCAAGPEAGSARDGFSLPESSEQESAAKNRWSFARMVAVCLGLGIVSGFFAYRREIQLPKDQLLFLSLVILYTGVGASMGGSNVWQSVKQQGRRILLFPCCITAGSLLGGVISGLALSLPFYVTVLSSGGMGYYSLTGAFMTGAYGVEAGTYGFLVNVLRDLFTILLLPLLARMSTGSAIASGAGSNMDTMLLPVINCCGREAGVTALLTGTILTFLIPLLLPFLSRLLPL